MNKAAKRYMKELKMLLTLRGKKEKQLFQGISLRLKELVESDFEITYERICEELGEPKEIVSEYFSNADTEYLSKNFRWAYYLRNTCVCLGLATIIALLLYSQFLKETKELLERDLVIYGIEYIEIEK